jgi:hypothetical protein
VQGADAIRIDGKIPAGEFGCGGAGETGHKNRILAEALDGATDLAREVRGFARAWSWGAEDTEFPRFFGPSLRDLVNSVCLESRLVRFHDRPFLLW